MNIEIINTSKYELPGEIVEEIESYAPYHNYNDTRNRLFIQKHPTKLFIIFCVMVRIDEGYAMIWVSDWYERYLEG